MWPDGARAILHVDMDAFYASVEQHDDPSLRGRPVIVGGPKKARGVVSAASYEARRFGVCSAMPLRRAARLCPGGIFVSGRMQRYREVSRRVFRILAEVTPRLEPLSVDEAFLDLTGCERLYDGGPTGAARLLRARIREECGLTASVGVAPNKFVAKIASDLHKPDGLVVALPGHVAEFLAPLKVERMGGIGPRGAEALHALGVRTFGDLAQAPLARLRPAFGAASAHLVALAAGRDARPVATCRALKSISHESTFREDTRDPERLHATLVELADKVAGRLRRQGLKARHVTLKIRYAPFRTLTRSATLPAATGGTGPLLEAAGALLQRRLESESTPVRLLGVQVAGFDVQGRLFAEEGARGKAIDVAVDSIRAKFGTRAVKRGCVLPSKGG